VIGSLALAIGVLASESPARAQGTARVGTLSCNVASGWGFVFGSSRALRCTFASARAVPNIMPAVFGDSGSISAIHEAVCSFGGCLHRPPIWRGRAGGRICRRNRKRHGRGWSRGQCVGRRFRPNDLASAGQSRRQHRLNVAAGIGAISLRYEPRVGRH